MVPRVLMVRQDLELVDSDRNGPHFDEVEPLPAAAPQNSSQVAL